MSDDAMADAMTAQLMGQHVDVFRRSVLLLGDYMAMDAVNRGRLAAGLALAYTEEAFEQVADKHGLALKQNTKEVVP